MAFNGCWPSQWAVRSPQWAFHWLGQSAGGRQQGLPVLYPVFWCASRYIYSQAQPNVLTQPTNVQVLSKFAVLACAPSHSPVPPASAHVLSLLAHFAFLRSHPHPLSLPLSLSCYFFVCFSFVPNFFLSLLLFYIDSLLILFSLFYYTINHYSLLYSNTLLAILRLPLAKSIIPSRGDPSEPLPTNHSPSCHPLIKTA